MEANSKLMRISYYDPTRQVRLSAYADTIIYETEGAENTLRAIRFGGYPEMVRAMSDAIYAGAGIDAELEGRTLHFISQIKRYTRQLTHDGVYAEATLLALDDDQDQEGKKAKGKSKKAGKDQTDQEENQESEEPDPTQAKPRKCCMFCPPDNPDVLFRELDHKTAIPLIPDFRDYLLDELQRRGILKRLHVLSSRNNLDAWILSCEAEGKNIAAAVEDGLRSGAISIPGEIKKPDGFDGVDTVTGYLNAFGVTVAQRIRTQFQPLFDPAAEPLSPELLAINDNIQACAGYSLYDAQLAVAEAVKRKLQSGKSAFIVAECGSGKTKIGASAMAAVYAALRALQANQAQRGGGKTFNLILCPSHVANKWAREIGETLPQTVGVVIRSIPDTP